MKGQPLAQPTAQRRLTLDAIFKSKVLDDKPLRSPVWLSDSRRVAYLDAYPHTKRTTIWIFDAETRERTPLVDPAKLRVAGLARPVPVHLVSPSDDGTRFLLTSEAPARFKPCGDLYVFDTGTTKLSRLTESSEEQYHPRFSPDGRTIGFVRTGDLWVVDAQSGQERRLTHDGGAGGAAPSNGRCGWVYEEELGLGRAWEWSPDGNAILFLQQDESSVPEALLPQFDQPHCEPRRTRYPKAGDPNPTVRVGLLDVTSATTRWVDLSHITGDRPAEHYVAHLQWAPDGAEALVQYLPRLQNRLLLIGVSAVSGKARTIIEESDEAWVDHPGKLHFVGETSRFLWPSERDGWRRLYLYDLSGECLGPVTPPQWETTGVAAIDAAGRRLFFMAARPSPVERRLFGVSLDGGEPDALTDAPGVHAVAFAPDASRYLHTHSTLNDPPATSVRSVAASDACLLTEDTRPVLERYGVPLGRSEDHPGWELMTFETEDGTTLHGRMLKPTDFDPSRRYPALMHTYGGPGSQVVTDSWGGKGALWYHYLAQRGYLVFLCDNRGTGGRGRDFRKVTYLSLGRWEVNDQISGARYLGSLPYVDPSRIAIWGWSYGGYMASLCILQGADVFRAAVAVAPVTDWRLYDSIYTERYMRTPEQNPDGYKDGSPVTHAAKLRGRFLLLHGTMDDNVHFQNAARLASALQDAGKQFETMFYPGRHHGIENRHRHLYGLITRFLRRAL